MGRAYNLSKHLKRWRLRLLGLVVSLLCLSAAAHGFFAPVQVTADGGMTGRMIFEATILLGDRIFWLDWLSVRVLIASIFTLTGGLVYIWSSAISYRQIASALAVLRHLRRLVPARTRSAARAELLDEQTDTARPVSEKLKNKKRKSPAPRKEPVILETAQTEDMAEDVAAMAIRKSRPQASFDFEGDGQFKLPLLNC